MNRIINYIFKLFACVSLIMPMCGMSSNYATTCASNGPFKTRDQFGVQLNHIVSVLSFAWDNQLIPYFPSELLRTAKGASINYPLFFSRLNQHLPFDIDKRDPIHIHHHDYASYAGRNVCLCSAPGYPFFHYRDRLREYFSPSRSIKRYLNQNYKEILNHPKTVAVHIRTFHPAITLQLFLGAEYYKSAMEHFPDDHLFVIFSDRIEWAKENLQGTKPNMVFIQGENHIIDFYLMTYCRNHIISNSNFSLMAAFFKRDFSGITLVPDNWLSNTRKEDFEGFYFPGCFVLPTNPAGSANWNLLNYSTTSIDEGGPQY